MDKISTELKKLNTKIDFALLVIDAECDDKEYIKATKQIYYECLDKIKQLDSITNKVI